MRYFASGLIGLLLAVPLLADEPAKTVAVPYRLINTKHIMVRVKLNGKGPFNLILDTGAPALFVSTASGKKAGVESGKDGWATFDKLEFEGGLVIEKAKGMIEDPFQLRGMNGMGLAGVELHGMIGYNIIAKYRIFVDLESDKLLFTPLDFNPPAPVRLGGGGGQPGGLELLGDVMKMLGPLLGMKNDPVKKYRGVVGIEAADEGATIVVKNVHGGSPADKAGLKVGDILVKIDDESLDDVQHLGKILNKKAGGAKLSVTIQRGGTKSTKTLELGKGL